MPIALTVLVIATKCELTKIVCNKKEYTYSLLDGCCSKIINDVSLVAKILKTNKIRYTVNWCATE